MHVELGHVYCVGPLKIKVQGQSQGQVPPSFMCLFKEYIITSQLSNTDCLIWYIALYIG